MPEPIKPTVQRILPPDKWVDRQISVLKDVGERNYRVGVATPKADPIAKGIEAEPVYAAQTKLAIDERRRAKALEATNMAEWGEYSGRFSDRLVPGVTVREKEVHDFVKPWHPMLLDHLAKIDPMAVVTLRERIDKAVANIEGLAALKGAWRARA